MGQTEGLAPGLASQGFQASKLCFRRKEGGVETQPARGSNTGRKTAGTGHLCSVSPREGNQQLGKPGSRSSQIAVRAANPRKQPRVRKSGPLGGLAGCCLPGGAVFTSLGIGTRPLQHMPVLRADQPAPVWRRGLSLTPSCLPQVLGRRLLLPSHILVLCAGRRLLL